MVLSPRTINGQQADGEINGQRPWSLENMIAAVENEIERFDVAGSEVDRSSSIPLRARTADFCCLVDRLFMTVMQADHAILERIVASGAEYWADPGRSQPKEWNTLNGGGPYFLDPCGRFLEILTRTE